MNLIKETRCLNQFHIGVNGDEDWNLICNSEIKATNGLYVYKIEQSNARGTKVIDSKIGKLLIMR